MKSHPKMLSVQMAATACLYNLTRGEVGQKIHPVVLAKCVDLTLAAMENFPNHQQVSSSKATIYIYNHGIGLHIFSSSRFPSWSFGSYIQLVYQDFYTKFLT